MVTIKKAKAKNISAGPSKKSPKAPLVDPRGQYTKVQQRTLGNMKKGGVIKKAQDGLRAKADNTSISKRPVSSIVKKSSPDFSQVGRDFPVGHPKRNEGINTKVSVRPMTYKITDLMNKKDSANYTKGYNEARSNYLQNKPVRKQITKYNDESAMPSDDTTSFRSRGYLEGQKKLGFKKKTGGSIKKYKSGGKVKKNWIQGAVNPAHKGYCTPMTKATCTPKRKALAKTFKKMAKARKG